MNGGGKQLGARRFGLGEFGFQEVAQGQKVGGGHVLGSRYALESDWLYFDE